MKEEKKELNVVDLYHLQLHEKFKIDDFNWIMKVPTGWIYYYHYNPGSDIVMTTFVPV